MSSTKEYFSSNRFLRIIQKLQLLSQLTIHEILESFQLRQKVENLENFGSVEFSKLLFIQKFINIKLRAATHPKQVVRQLLVVKTRDNPELDRNSMAL